MGSNLSSRNKIGSYIFYSSSIPTSLPYCFIVSVCEYNRIKYTYWAMTVKRMWGLYGEQDKSALPYPTIVSLMQLADAFRDKFPNFEVCLFYLLTLASNLILMIPLIMVNKWMGSLNRVFFECLGLDIQSVYASLNFRTESWELSCSL